jgi:hypothetical protein
MHAAARPKAALAPMRKPQQTDEGGGPPRLDPGVDGGQVWEEFVRAGHLPAQAAEGLPEMGDHCGRDMGVPHGVAVLAGTVHDRSADAVAGEQQR